MKHLEILLLGSMALAACASNKNLPPAASSETIAQATDQPNRGPDFAPASTDGLSAAPADARRASVAQPTPAVNPTSDQKATSSNTSSDTWGNGANGSSGIDPSTGNAAAAPANRTTPATTDADNSRVNQRDRSTSTLTPMDQGPSDSDRKITQQIRQAVMADKSLSFTAKNVKIITINGKVTLRGPVKTDAERATIEAAARRAVGDGAAVDSQLELAK